MTKKALDAELVGCGWTKADYSTPHNTHVVEAVSRDRNLHTIRVQSPSRTVAYSLLLHAVVGYTRNTQQKASQ